MKMDLFMFPKVLEEFLGFRTKLGPVETLDTRFFLAGPSIAESLYVNLRQIFLQNFTEISLQTQIEKGENFPVKVLAIGDLR